MSVCLFACLLALVLFCFVLFCFVLFCFVLHGFVTRIINKLCDACARIMSKLTTVCFECSVHSDMKQKNTTVQNTIVNQTTVCFECSVHSDMKQKNTTVQNTIVNQTTVCFECSVHSDMKQKNTTVQNTILNHKLSIFFLIKVQAIREIIEILRGIKKRDVKVYTTLFLTKELMILNDSTCILIACPFGKNLPVTSIRFCIESSDTQMFIRFVVFVNFIWGVGKKYVTCITMTHLLEDALMLL